MPTAPLRIPMAQTKMSRTPSPMPSKITCKIISASPHFAFFAVPDLFGMVTPENLLIFNCEADAVAVDEGTAKGGNLLPGKAYLQKLYDDIAKR